MIEVVGPDYPNWQLRATEWVQLLQNSTSLRGILEELVGVLPWRVIGFYRVVEGQNRVFPEVGKGYEKIGLEYAVFPLFPEKNLISYCYSRKETIRLRTQAEVGPLDLGEKSRAIMSQLNVDVAVAIPLIHGGSVVGVIYIADASEADLSDAAIAALESIAPILASMISKQQLIEIMEHENQALHWMQEMSQVLLFVRSEEELWRQFRDMLIQLGKVAGGVYLVREGEWRVHDVFGILLPYKERLGQDTIQWVKSRLTENWRSRLVTWTKPGVRVMPDYVDEESECGRGLRYYVGDNDELAAVMTLYFAAPDTSVDRLLPSLLQMFSLAFQVLRQRRQLEHLSSQDALTGLGNRRALETYMEAYFQGRERGPAILLLCDLDGFKKLNDTEGHQRGDMALREIAQYLQQYLQGNRVACRFGGDEFVLVLADTRWDEVRDRMSQWVLNSPLGKYQLSATMGIVELPTESEDFTECYRLADERLYHGKRSGKNCMVGPTGVYRLI